MAVLTRGKTFTATEQVTNTKLHNLVDLGSVSEIDSDDMKSGFGLVVVSASAPDNTDCVWYDSVNSLFKVYVGSTWTACLFGSTGTTVGLIPILGSTYVFVVSGMSVLPTAGATYTNNGVTYTVTGTSTPTVVYATGASAPETSGTLTKATGTGDAAVTFSDVTAQLAAVDGALLRNVNLGTSSGSAPLYAARAWCKFNGTGTQAIISSGNVSSVTDNANGDSTIAFTTAMPDANYIAVFGGQSDSDLTHFIGVQCKATYATPLVGSLRIRFIDSLGAEALDVYVAIFR